MDVVFDRTAEGRVLKWLTVVVDATHESVAVEVKRAISGHGVARILDRLTASRCLPHIVHNENGKEFCGKAMLEWAHRRDVQHPLTESGNPNVNAYIESFNDRPRDKSVKERWLPNLLQAGSVIEPWRREYNKERPNQALGGMTPRGLCESPCRG